jgi:biotin-(acetyl-CoA carboxylase) ligase
MTNTNETKAKKMTKKDYFNKLLEIEAVKADAELTAFVEHELELLANKNKVKNGEKKPTERQKQNEILKAEILKFMEPEKKYGGSDFIKNVEALNGESNQRVASLMKQLMEKEGAVEKLTEKGKVYWKLV